MKTSEFFLLLMLAGAAGTHADSSSAATVEGYKVGLTGALTYAKSDRGEWQQIALELARFMDRGEWA